MIHKAWAPPVSVDIRSDGVFCQVFNGEHAARILAHEWPIAGNKFYDIALWACAGVIQTAVGSAKARATFIDACIEARLSYFS